MAWKWSSGSNKAGQCLPHIQRDREVSFRSRSPLAPSSHTPAPGGSLLPTLHSLSSSPAQNASLCLSSARITGLAAAVSSLCSPGRPRASYKEVSLWQLSYTPSLVCSSQSPVCCFAVMESAVKRERMPAPSPVYTGHSTSQELNTDWSGRGPNESCVGAAGNSCLLMSLPSSRFCSGKK